MPFIFDPRELGVGEWGAPHGPASHPLFETLDSDKFPELGRRRCRSLKVNGVLRKRAAGVPAQFSSSCTGEGEGPSRLSVGSTCGLGCIVLSSRPGAGCWRETGKGQGNLGQRRKLIYSHHSGGSAFIS